MGFRLRFSPTNQSMPRRFQVTFVDAEGAFVAVTWMGQTVNMINILNMGYFWEYIYI